MLETLRNMSRASLYLSTMFMIIRSGFSGSGLKHLPIISPVSKFISMSFSDVKSYVQLAQLVILAR